MPRVPLHYHLSNTGLFRLPIRFLSSIFQQKIPLHRPTRIHLKNCPVNLRIPSRAHIQLPPKQNSIMFTQPYYFLKFYPNTSPSTHTSYHPYQYPTITPSTRPTPTPSHTWAIPGRLASCAQGLRRYYKPPISHSLSLFITVVRISPVR